MNGTGPDNKKGINYFKLLGLFLIFTALLEKTLGFLCVWCVFLGGFFFPFLPKLKMVHMKYKGGGKCILFIEDLRNSDETRL